MTGQFHWLDWVVLVLYIAGTSWLADRLTDRGQTIRDFFLGGRKLPWWAVSGSIVASEVSGVTFVALPAIAFARGGNYTYMMLAIGSILARILIAYFLIPAYYRHEIYSPYEFMGRRLGPGVVRGASVIFLIGVVLGQGARLFLAAIVLDAITNIGAVPAIILLTLIGVGWTWIGGITSVVWTDVVQFVMIALGATASVVAVIVAVPGGVDGIIEAGRAAGKFQLLDFSLSPTAEFTFWCGLFGFTFLTLGSHGTDQTMAQRFFCCRNAREARKAVMWSSVAMILPLIMLTVGVGLYAYFQQFPMNAAQLAKVSERSDYIFPIFILQAMPVVVKGLLFASIFSAATQTAAISAMAQTGLSLYERAAQRGDGRAPAPSPLSRVCRRCRASSSVSWRSSAHASSSTRTCCVSRWQWRATRTARCSAFCFSPCCPSGAMAEGWCGACRSRFCSCSRSTGSIRRGRVG